MKIGRLHARKIGAKCVKTRKKFVRSVLTLPWSCLRQKKGSERAVHMCGHGPKVSSLNTYGRGGGLRMPKNADLLDSYWLGSQSRGPDALWLDIRSTTAAWRSHEFGKTKKKRARLLGGATSLDGFGTCGPLSQTQCGALSLTQTTLNDSERFQVCLRSRNFEK